MSIIPITTAVQLAPVAIAAGKVATKAVGSFAEMLQRAISNPENSGDTQSFSDQVRDFTGRFRQLLSGHNVSTSAPVTLSLGKQGLAQVGRSHPQAAGIQNLLSNSPKLLEQFRQLAGRASHAVPGQPFQLTIPGR